MGGNEPKKYICVCARVEHSAVQSTDMNTLDEFALQNIFGRLPLHDVLGVILLTGQKKFLQMLCRLLRKVNLLSYMDVACLNSLYRSTEQGKLAFHSIVSLYIDIPLNHRPVWLTSLPKHLETLCNNRASCEIAVQDSSNLSKLQHLRSVTLYANLLLEHLPEQIEQLETSYREWHQISLSGATWPYLRRLSLRRSAGGCGKKLVCLNNDLCPQLTRLSLKKLDCHHIMQNMITLPNIALLSRLSLSFVDANALGSFFKNIDLCILIHLIYLKVECRYIVPVHVIKHLPPKLKVLQFTAAGKVEFPGYHNSLEYVMSAGNEHIRGSDGSWYTWKQQLADPSTTAEQLVSRSKFLQRVFGGRPKHLMPDIATSVVNSIYFIERCDIAAPLFMMLECKRTMWVELSWLQCAQRLRHMPVDKYNLKVFWHVRCILHQYRLASKSSDVIEILDNWITANMERFNPTLLKHLLWMLRWLCTDDKDLMSLVDKFKEAEPDLDSNVVASFCMVFGDMRRDLNLEQFGIAFQMASDCVLARRCCAGLAPSAWFDQYPLMRNVTMVKSELSGLLSDGSGSYDTLKNHNVLLQHNLGQFFILVEDKSIIFWKSMIGRQGDIFRCDSGRVCTSSLQEVKKFAQHVKALFP